MRHILSYFLLVVTTILGGLGLTSHNSTTPESQQANVVSSVVSKPTPTPSQDVGVGTTTTTKVTPTPSTPSSTLTKSQVKSIVDSTLDSYVKSGKFRGPKGDRGEDGKPGANGQNGSSGINTSYTTPTGVVIPAQNLTVSYTPPGASNPGSIGNITYFASKELTTDKLTVNDTANLNKLNVTGASTFSSLLTSSILPQTAGSVTLGVVTTEILTANPNGSGGSGLYNDSQKFITIGSDGFVRFVYFDNNWHDVHLVRCLDTDCTTKNDTVVATGSNGVDATLIKMGSDGYPRIVYIKYETPNELHFIKCSNDDCTSKSDNLVDTSDSVGMTWFYSVGFVLASDDTARIVYDNYDSATVDKVRFATCLDTECASSTLTTIVSSGQYTETVSVALAPDGLSRIAYIDYSTTPDEIHFVQCTNSTCSSNINTVVSTDDGLYHMDLVVGSDGFGRIVYGNPTQQKFVQCTNSACSTSNMATIDDTTEGNSQQNSVVLGTDGLPRIAYQYNSPASVHYVQCQNAACTAKNTVTITEAGGYHTGISLGNDGYSRIIYVGSNRKTIYLSRLGSDEGQDIYSGVDIGASNNKFNNIFGQKISVDQLYLGGTLFSLDSQWVTSGSNLGFTGGNVGIGTTTPASLLHVSSETFGTAGKITLGADIGSDGILGAIDFQRNHYDPLGRAAAINFVRQGGANDGGIAFATNPGDIGAGQSPIERMRITSSGYVGIANTNPLALLDIGSGKHIQLGNNGGQNYLKFKGSDDNLSWITTDQHDLMVAPVTGIIRMTTANGSGDPTNNGVFNIGAISSSPPGWGLKTTSSVQMRFDSGNVDINTDDFVFNHSNSSATRRLFDVQENGSSVLTILPSGNVGVGNTNPQRLFDVTGVQRVTATTTTLAYSENFVVKKDLAQAAGSYTEIADFNFENGSFNLEVDIIDGQSGGGAAKKYVITGNYDDYVASGWKEVLPMYSTGERGGDYTLDIAGGGIAGSDKIRLRLRTTRTTFMPTLNITLHIKAVNTPLVSTLNNSGVGATVSGIFRNSSLTQYGSSVGIGTSTPWKAFSVVGTLALDGLSTGPGAGTLCLSAGKEVLYSAGATCTVSSAKFKHDIATSTTGLDLINKLRPVTFFYNDDIGVPGEQYGFIAEEVEQLDTKLVVHDKDNKPFSVKYENMTAILAKAIQEQQTQINQIKASTTGPIIHDESSLMNDLKYYSGQILTGIWHFVEIVTDKITATLGVFKKVETENIDAQEICLTNSNGKTCVTRDELDALLHANNISPSTRAETNTQNQVSDPSGPTTSADQISVTNSSTDSQNLGGNSSSSQDTLGDATTTDATLTN